MEGSSTRQRLVGRQDRRVRESFVTLELQLEADLQHTLQYGIGKQILKFYLCMVQHNGPYGECNMASKFDKFDHFDI